MSQVLRILGTPRWSKDDLSSALALALETQKQDATEPKKTSDATPSSGGDQGTA